MTELPATVLADQAWLRDDLGRAARLYGQAGDRVLGTVRWYSASSVLVAPALEPFVHTGRPRDPALDAVLLDVHADGRLLDARSERALDGGTAALGEALGEALGSVVEAIASVSGASPQSLWAIASDSIANRMLWAGSATGHTAEAMRLAGELGDAVNDAVRVSGAAMPRPRFADVAGRPVVRRASCCLIYETGTGQKCVSCPRQTPEERWARLRSLLG